MKRILYTGLTPPSPNSDELIIHYPVIEILPRACDDKNIAHIIRNLHKYSHVIFTSKTTVRIFCQLIDCAAFKDKVILSVGKATSLALVEAGVKVNFTAEREQAEGILDVFRRMNLDKANVLWPHSDRARTTIGEYLSSRRVEFDDVVFYETQMKQTEVKVPFEKFDVIVFTSPSTVDGFLSIYGVIPSDKEIRCIGPITEKHLQKCK